MFGAAYYEGVDTLRPVGSPFHRKLEDDVWYHKMNDTMETPELKKAVNATRTLLLRYDGYTLAEIQTFTNSSGRITMPSLNDIAIKVKSLNGKTDITQDEIAKLHARIPCEKIIWNQPA